MRQCSRCQGNVDPDAQRCPHCGAWLSEQPDVPEPIPDSGDGVPDSKPAATDLEQQILQLLVAGKTIAAIKLYREQTKVGLKEAKDAVDALAAQNEIVPPRGSGCFAVLGLLLASLSLVLIGSMHWL